MTACFLINRMPSIILNGQTPHSIIFPTASVFPLPPRVFGCLAFVHNLEKGIDKLTPRASRCIFLGYTRYQKGYRCYCPTRHRYLICADVTFFKSTPYYHEDSCTESEGGPLPEPVIPILPQLTVDPSHVSDAPPVRVYTRRTHSNVHALPPAPPTIMPASSVPDVTLELPIAIRKRPRTCTTHPISHFVSYD